MLNQNKGHKIFINLHSGFFHLNPACRLFFATLTMPTRVGEVKAYLCGWLTGRFKSEPSKNGIGLQPDQHRFRLLVCEQNVIDGIWRASTDSNPDSHFLKLTWVQITDDCAALYVHVHDLLRLGHSSIRSVIAALCTMLRDGKRRTTPARLTIMLSRRWHSGYMF